MQMDRGDQYPTSVDLRCKADKLFNKGGKSMNNPDTHVITRRGEEDSE